MECNLDHHPGDSSCKSAKAFDNPSQSFLNANIVCVCSCSLLVSLSFA